MVGASVMSMTGDAEQILFETSVDGRPLSTFFERFADQAIYLAIRCPESIAGIDTDSVAVYAAEYREGQLHYAFSSQAKFSDWANNNDLAEQACFVSLLASDYSETVGSPGYGSVYLVIDIDTGPVLLEPADLNRLSR